MTDRKPRDLYRSVFGLCLAILSSCAPKASAPATPKDAGSAPMPKFLFEDVAPGAGIDVINVCGDPRRWYIPESNGTGAAWLDYDGDGDMDLFVPNCGGMLYHEDGARLEIVRSATSRLYRNEGGMKFTDVSEAAGAQRTDWINAVATGDVDGDGDVDLYLACLGDDVFLENMGGHFRDASQRANLKNPYWGTGASFADVDRDGDLDLYVSNYCLFDPAHPPAEGKRANFDGVEVAWGPEGENKQGINPGAPDLFFRNRGDGTFEESTEQAGFALEKDLCSYAAVFSDVSGDGWPDLLVANDLQPSNLFINRKDGSFKDEGLERGFSLNLEGKPTSAMGLMVADVDRDGDFDVLRTNFDFEPNSMHLNQGSGRFIESAGPLGLADPSVERLGWGGGFFDADLDGDLDLLVANGHVFPQATEIGMSPWEEQSQLFEASTDDGGQMHWTPVDAGPGLALLRSARGVAIGDPDDDGDLDLLIMDIDHAPRLLENKSTRQGHFLGLKLVGQGSNTGALGARVRVFAGEAEWVQEARTSGGLYSAHDPRLHFGLGQVDSITRIEVLWPDGKTQTFPALALDQYHTLRQAE